MLSQTSRLKTFDLINSIVRTTPDYTKFQIGKYDELKAKKRFFNIFFVENYKSFEQICQKISPENFDYQGKFVIVITGKLQNVYEDIKQSMVNMWKKFIVNIVVLIKSKNGSKAHIYTFLPFTKSHCGEVRPVLWNIFVKGRFKSEKRLYPKNVKELSNCPLNVASFNSPLMKIRLKNKA